MLLVNVITIPFFFSIIKPNFVKILKSASNKLKSTLYCIKIRMGFLPKNIGSVALIIALEHWDLTDSKNVAISSFTH